MTGTDVPEENRLAEAVVWGLREGAGASDGAAAIVKPVTRDVPVGNLSHEDLQAEESYYVEKLPDSFDHLVGSRKQGLGHGQSERFRGRQIDDQLEFSRLFDWKVSGLCPFEDPINKITRTAEKIRCARAIRDETSGCERVTEWINCG